MLKVDLASSEPEQQDFVTIAVAAASSATATYGLLSPI